MLRRRPPNLTTSRYFRQSLIRKYKTDQGTSTSFDSETDLSCLVLPDVDIIPKFTQIECDSCQIVLENCVDQLLILSAPKPRTAHYLHYPNMIHRFINETRESIFDTETNKLIKTTHDIRRLLKLQKDRDLLAKILEMTIDEIKNTSTTIGMAEFLKEEKNQENGIYKLLGEYAKNKATYSTLKTTLEEERKKYEEKIKQKKTKLKEYQNVAEEAVFLSGVQMAYCQRWEKSRVDQNTIIYETEEKKLNDEMEENAESAEIDNTVHESILAYLEFSEEDIQAQIDWWTQFYNTDIDSMDIEITTYKANIEGLKKTTDELEKIYAERQEKIDAYLDEKREREREAAQKQHLEDCAIKIQAWWRGTMVRRNLGPYKKSKKKAKKAKKASKK